MYRSIIVGVDGRDGGLDALALARVLAQAGGGRLTLACSYLSDPIGTRLVPAEAKSLRERAVALLEAARGTLEGLETEVRPVATSSPAHGLHDLAEELGADLIVVGSSHRGALGRVLPGSTTQQVLHGSPCAVAVAPAGLRDRAPQELRRIGVAYDAGREAHAALAVGRELTAELGGSLEIVDVFSPTIVFPPLAIDGGYPEPVEDLEAYARRELDDALASVDEVPANGALLEGDAATQLVTRSGSLDLLVMGSRAYGPLRRVLLGTVAGKVIREAQCPVIVVPRGVHDEAEGAEPAAATGAAA